MSVTNVGCRLRSITQKRNHGRFRLRLVTQKRNQGRFAVTLGYAKTEPRSVPGYAKFIYIYTFK